MSSQIIQMHAVSRCRNGMVYKKSPIPNCGPNDLLIKVKAAAINPIDYKIFWPLGHSVVGFDFAGTIDKLGSKVETFNVGDEVYGVCKGSLAQYTVCNVKNISMKPKNLSFVESASMPMTYVTSLQGLKDYGKLKEGGSVLIIGASGGCGVASIQLAKALGASDIVGVCSGKNAEFVKSHGATEVIDYTKEDIVDYCSENGEIKNAFDVVYDAATGSGCGEDYKERSLKLLKKETSDNTHGQYVSINGSAGMIIRALTIGNKANEHLFFMNKDCKSDLSQLAELVESEKLKPFIGKQLVLNAESVKEGFDLLKSRRSIGKIVFEIDHNI